jgi:hypothetical protein
MHRARVAGSAGVVLVLIAGAVWVVRGAGAATTPRAQSPVVTNILTPSQMAVLAWNDLGMHCMGQDNSELMILPPYNNLHAQVIDRTHGSPEIVSSGVTVRYTIPSNTHSADKDNFWTYAHALLGVTLQPNIGLTGNGLSGTMAPTGDNDWAATGIPITPIDDSGRENPYPLATVTVIRNGAEVARTQAVVPVSWEMNCQICHNTPGISVATDILRRHDQLHGTTLESQKPVLCAQCHADNALGLPGVTGVSNLSSAMHTAHAPRMAAANLAMDCYACHPGFRTQCLRDVHFSAGKDCHFCHGTMADVGNPARNPWVDEPRCGNCHVRAGFEFEQPGLLFKQSKGHRGIHCGACHGSPHAITPTVMDTDNLQANAVQGHPGIINTCTTCHSTTPSDPFPHRLIED